MKIAIAVDIDKQTVFKKTGQAAFFAIYEDEKLLELIQNFRGQGEHGNGTPQGGAHHKHTRSHENMDETQHTNEHKKEALLLQDCDIILVQAIGENMKAAIESMGITVKKIRQKHGVTADEVIKNFLADNI